MASPRPPPHEQCEASSAAHSDDHAVDNHEAAALTPISRTRERQQHQSPPPGYLPTPIRAEDLKYEVVEETLQQFMRRRTGRYIGILALDVHDVMDALCPFMNKQALSAVMQRLLNFAGGGDSGPAFFESMANDFYSLLRYKISQQGASSSNILGSGDGQTPLSESPLARDRRRSWCTPNIDKAYLKGISPLYDGSKTSLSPHLHHSLQVTPRETPTPESAQTAAPRSSSLLLPPGSIQAWHMRQPESAWRSPATMSAENGITDEGRAPQTPSCSEPAVPGHLGRASLSPAPPRPAESQPSVSSAGSSKKERKSITPRSGASQQVNPDAQNTPQRRSATPDVHQTPKASTRSTSSSPAGKTHLPPGWEAAWSKEHSRHYYFCRTSGERRWKAPCAPNTNQEPVASPCAVSSVALPGDFQTAGSATTAPDSSRVKLPVDRDASSSTLPPSQPDSYSESKTGGFVPAYQSPAAVSQRSAAVAPDVGRAASQRTIDAASPSQDRDPATPARSSRGSPVTCKSPPPPGLTTVAPSPAPMSPATLAPPMPKSLLDNSGEAHDMPAEDADLEVAEPLETAEISENSEQHAPVDAADTTSNSQLVVAEPKPAPRKPPPSMAAMLQTVRATPLSLHRRHEIAFGSTSSRTDSDMSRLAEAAASSPEAADAGVGTSDVATNGPVESRADVDQIADKAAGGSTEVPARAASEAPPHSDGSSLLQRSAPVSFPMERRPRLDGSPRFLKRRQAKSSSIAEAARPVATPFRPLQGLGQPRRSSVRDVPVAFTAKTQPATILRALALPAAWTPPAYVSTPEDDAKEPKTFEGPRSKKARLAADVGA